MNSGVVVLGAGRSSRYLLKQLSAYCHETQRPLVVCDASEQELKKHAADLHADCRVMNVANTAELEPFIAGKEMVVSLLPPAMHPAVAELCLKYKVHFASASYVSDAMRNLNDAAAQLGLVFLNELGLDPGIDHLSAMKAMDEIRAEGGEITSFESYCGGLVTENDCVGNPWKYKFSWNPRNVVLAGQGGDSIFRVNHQLRSIPWHRLFAEANPLEIPGIGEFDAYANRDSLTYSSIYGLNDVPTLIRGTLRRKDYCKNWQVLVSLGFTDAQSALPPNINTIHDLTCTLTGKPRGQRFSDWLIENRWIDETYRDWFNYLELDSDKSFAKKPGNAAELLELVLLDRWRLLPGDHDEVVMYHKIGFVKNGQSQLLHSVMCVTGEDEMHTAMAKTVGLPLALGVELVLSGSCPEKGVVFPISRYWYNEILPRLEKMGIRFEEQTEFCR